jgi:hypothetical protein
MAEVKFIAEYEDGSKEPFDIPQADLRRGELVTEIVARERQTGPIGYPRLKSGVIVRVYRDPTHQAEAKNKESRDGTPG